MAVHRLWTLTVSLLLAVLLWPVLGAPAVCRSCRGQCKNVEVGAVNVTDTEFLDEIVDNETGRLLNLTSVEKDENENLLNITSMEATRSTRHRRQSYIEKRTCSSKFQMELFMIPLSIAMIPVALVSLLLCVCFCGPKDSRGQVPDKILGVRLSQKRRLSNDGAEKKTAKEEGDELEYKDGYVQRKDSKKTRFATNVLFIEPLRRASSVSCLEGMASRRGSCISGDGLTSRSFDDSGSVSGGGGGKASPLKKTRFSDSVSVLGEEVPTVDASSRTAARKAAFIQRSVSVT